MMEYLASLTDKQLLRLNRKLRARLDRAYGYQPFGIDWRTMRLTEPGLYNTIQRVVRENARRHFEDR